MSGRAATVRPPAAAARFLKPLTAEAARLGQPLFVVGGPVRDWILGRSTFDLDLTVQGDPDPIAALCARLIGGTVEPFGRFGTRRVIGTAKFRVDVATTRAESYSAPAALPDLTATKVPIEQDLFRRDFTINAMAARIDDGSYALVDPYGGRADLKAKVLRVLHPASFRDDPTRVFRAARFLARLKAKPAAGMADEARDALVHAKALSPHRRLRELLCLLGEKDPARAFAILKEWGYLSLLAPELPWSKTMPAGVEPRLFALTLALGWEEGKVFSDAFPFERQLRARLHEALELAFSSKTPKISTPAEVLAAVRRFSPELPAAALKPCFLTGADLVAAGRKPGPDFQELLNLAAFLQRDGRFKTRAAALAWLKSRPA